MILFQCDCCLVVEDEETKVYELSQEVKDETCLPYDHLCKECFDDLEDKTLQIKNKKIVFRRANNGN